MGAHDRGGIPLEGGPPGEQLVQEDAEGIDVATSIERPPRCLLGRHVGRGADGGARHGQPLAPEDLLIRLHLQRLVVDDDPVKVEKNGLNH